MEDLLQKALSGDKKAEKEIFQYLSVRFKYLAKRRVGEKDFEDLAQQACITIFEKYKNEEFTESFQAWAYGVLKMKIGNYIKAKRRMSGKQISLDGVSGLSDARTHDPLLKRILIECVRKLVKAHKEYMRVLNLTQQGYGTEDICEKCNIKPNYYYVTLNRGRAKLKECLKKEGVLQ